MSGLPVIMLFRNVERCGCCLSLINRDSFRSSEQGTDSVHNFTVGNISMEDISVIGVAGPEGAHPKQTWLSAGVGPYCAGAVGAAGGWTIDNRSIVGTASVSWASSAGDRSAAAAAAAAAAGYCSVATPAGLVLDGVRVRCLLL
jgi:hypothetical protein